MLENTAMLETYLSDGQIEGRLTFHRDYPLSKLSTFRIGGNAAYAVYPKSTDEFAALTALCVSLSIPYTVLGNGSNVLCADDGYEGVVLVTTDMNAITREGNTVKADCGVSLTYLASYAGKEGLGGLSFAYGIPGTVGGAVFMNAGAYGGEMKDVITSVSWYDPLTDESGEYSSEDCCFGYRESVFQKGDKIILSMTVALTPADPAVLRAEMEELMARRRDKQPLEFPSAGSTFKRYPGYFTGKLIEEAGLKGYTVGGAQVSEKHAGFVINIGNATAADVLALIEHIKGVIFEKNGIHIECEVRYLTSADGKERGNA